MELAGEDENKGLGDALERLRQSHMQVMGQSQEKNSLFKGEELFSLPQIET